MTDLERFEALLYSPKLNLDRAQELLNKRRQDDKDANEAWRLEHARKVSDDVRRWTHPEHEHKAG